MTTDYYQRIRSHPLFSELVRRRRRLATCLTAFVLSSFFGYVLVIALRPAWLASPISVGATTTIAIPVGLMMIILYWLLTGLYIRTARQSLETINRQLLKEALK